MKWRNVSFIHRFCMIALLILSVNAVLMAQTDTATLRPAISLQPDTINTGALAKLDSALNEYGSNQSSAMMIQPLHDQPIPYFLFVIFLGLFALITLIRFRYSKEFNDSISVFMNNSNLQQSYREALVSGVRPGNIMLMVNFITLLSIWIYLNTLTDQYSISRYGYLTIILSWLIILLILVIRTITIRIAAYLTNKSKEVGFFHFIELQLVRIVGIALFPLVLLQGYAPQLIAKSSSYVILALLLLMFLYRYFRVYGTLSQAYGKNLFHFLIYICALEIAPVLIGIKLILKNIL